MKYRLFSYTLRTRTSSLILIGPMFIFLSLAVWAEVENIYEHYYLLIFFIPLIVAILQMIYFYYKKKSTFEFIVEFILCALTVFLCIYEFYFSHELPPFIPSIAISMALGLSTSLFIFKISNSPMLPTL